MTKKRSAKKTEVLVINPNSVESRRTRRGGAGSGSATRLAGDTQTLATIQKMLGATPQKRRSLSAPVKDRQRNAITYSTVSAPKKNRGASAGNLSMLSEGFRKSELECNTAECAWKLGMFDPEFASRGPGTTPRPTVLLTYYSSTTFSTSANAIAGEGDPASSNNYMLDPNGNMAIIISPMLNTAIDGAGTGTRLVNVGAANGSLTAGFVCQGDFDMTCTTYGTTSDATSLAEVMHLNGGQSAPSGTAPLAATVTPLDSFNAPFPAELVFHTTTPANAYDFVPFRFIGMRTTLECVSSVAGTSAAQGSAMAGDFSDYMIRGERGWSHLDQSGVNSVFDSDGVAIIEEDTIDYEDYQLNNGNGYQRITELGALTAGSIYEAVALPINEDFWQYHMRSNFFDPTRTFQSSSTTGAFCSALPGFSMRFRPTSMFVLKGLVPGNTFRIGVTLTTEVQVDFDSPIGFLYNQARFARDFTPKLQHIRAVPSAGVLGSSLNSYMMADPAGHQVFVSRATGSLQTGAIPPATAPAVGAVGSTSRGSKAATQGVGEVISYLKRGVGKAAQFAVQNPALIAKGIGFLATMV